jgi:nitronate monooxygenase
VPVLAAGGLSTGGDFIAARALGADGIVLGTALLAAAESFAHDYHKYRLLAAAPGDTLLTDIFHINWPPGARVRVLSNAVTVGGRGREVEGVRTAIGNEDGRPIYLFSTDSPLRCTRGDLESMALYAGTGVGSVTAIRSAAAILDGIVAEAEQLLAPARATAERSFAEPSSSVCYAGEMGGAYMGQLEAADADAEARALVRDIATLLSHHRRNRGENAPPFSREFLILSPWLLALASFGSAAHPLPPSPERSLALEALPGRIGLLSTRVPDGPLRHTLVGLRAAVERIVPRSSVERRAEAV